MRKTPARNTLDALKDLERLAIDDADAIPPGRRCSEPGCRNPAAYVVRKRHTRGGSMRSYVCARHYRRQA